MALEHAYDNRGSVKDADAIIEGWAKRAKLFRYDGNFAARLNQSYGDHPRHQYDLFKTPQPKLGTVFYIHGGWWRALNKDYFSHLAEAYLIRGYDVVMLNYPLVDSSSLPEITASIAQAINLIAKQDYGPYFIIGHSAGGHLAIRQVCENTELGAHVLNNLKCVTGISGLYDLEPLRALAMNEEFKINDDIAVSESPYRQQHLDHVLNICVGGDELPAFIEQSKRLSDSWPKAHYIEQENSDHFTVIDQLSNPTSKLLLATLGMHK